MALYLSPCWALTKGNDVLSTFQHDIRSFLDEFSNITHFEGFNMLEHNASPALKDLNEACLKEGPQTLLLSQKFSANAQRIFTTFSSLQEDLEKTLRELNALAKGSNKSGSLNMGDLMACTPMHYVPTFYDEEMMLTSLEIHDLDLDVAKEAAATSAAAKRLHEHAAAAASSYNTLRQEALMKELESANAAAHAMEEDSASEVSLSLQNIAVALTHLRQANRLRDLSDVAAQEARHLRSEARFKRSQSRVAASQAAVADTQSQLLQAILMMNKRSPGPLLPGYDLKQRPAGGSSSTTAAAAAAEEDIRVDERLHPAGGSSCDEAIMDSTRGQDFIGLGLNCNASDLFNTGNPPDHNIPPWRLSPLVLLNRDQESSASSPLPGLGSHQTSTSAVEVRLQIDRLKKHGESFHLAAEGAAHVAHALQKQARELLLKSEEYQEHVEIATEEYGNKHQFGLEVSSAVPEGGVQALRLVAASKLRTLHTDMLRNAESALQEEAGHREAARRCHAGSLVLEKELLLLGNEGPRCSTCPAEGSDYQSSLQSPQDSGCGRVVYRSNEGHSCLTLPSADDEKRTNIMQQHDEQQHEQHGQGIRLPSSSSAAGSAVSQSLSGLSHLLSLYGTEEVLPGSWDYYFSGVAACHGSGGGGTLITGTPAGSGPDGHDKFIRVIAEGHPRHSSTMERVGVDCRDGGDDDEDLIDDVLVAFTQAAMMSSGRLLNDLISARRMSSTGGLMSVTEAPKQRSESAVLEESGNLLLLDANVREELSARCLIEMAKLVGLARKWVAVGKQSNKYTSGGSKGSSYAAEGESSAACYTTTEQQHANSDLRTPHHEGCNPSSLVAADSHLQQKVPEQLQVALLHAKRLASRALKLQEIASGVLGEVSLAGMYCNSSSSTVTSSSISAPHKDNFSSKSTCPADSSLQQTEILLQQLPSPGVPPTAETGVLPTAETTPLSISSSLDPLSPPADFSTRVLGPRQQSFEFWLESAAPGATSTATAPTDHYSRGATSTASTAPTDHYSRGATSTATAPTDHYSRGATSTASTAPTDHYNNATPYLQESSDIFSWSSSTAAGRGDDLLYSGRAEVSSVGESLVRPIISAGHNKSSANLKGLNIGSSWLAAVDRCTCGDDELQAGLGVAADSSVTTMSRSSAIPVLKHSTMIKTLAETASLPWSQAAGGAEEQRRLLLPTRHVEQAVGGVPWPLAAAAGILGAVAVVPHADAELAEGGQLFKNSSSTANENTHDNLEVKAAEQPAEYYLQPKETASSRTSESLMSVLPANLEKDLELPSSMAESGCRVGNAAHHTDAAGLHTTGDKLRGPNTTPLPASGVNPANVVDVRSLLRCIPSAAAVSGLLMEKNNEGRHQQTAETMIHHPSAIRLQAAGISSDHDYTTSAVSSLGVPGVPGSFGPGPGTSSGLAARPQHYVVAAPQQQQQGPGVIIDPSSLCKQHTTRDVTTLTKSQKEAYLFTSSDQPSTGYAQLRQEAGAARLQQQWHHEMMAGAGKNLVSQLSTSLPLFEHDDDDDDGDHYPSAGALMQTDPLLHDVNLLAKDVELRIASLPPSSTDNNAAQQLSKKVLKARKANIEARLQSAEASLEESRRLISERAGEAGAAEERADLARNLALELMSKGWLVDSSEASSLASLEGSRLIALREEVLLLQKVQVQHDADRKKLQEKLEMLTSQAAMAEGLFGTYMQEDQVLADEVEVMSLLKTMRDNVYSMLLCEPSLASGNNAAAAVPHQLVDSMSKASGSSNQMTNAEEKHVIRQIGGTANAESSSGTIRRQGQDFRTQPLLLAIAEIESLILSSPAVAAVQKEGKLSYLHSVTSGTSTQGIVSPASSAECSILQRVQQLLLCEQGLKATNGFLETGSSTEGSTRLQANNHNGHLGRAQDAASSFQALRDCRVRLCHLIAAHALRKSEPQHNSPSITAQQPAGAGSLFTNKIPASDESAAADTWLPEATVRSALAAESTESIRKAVLDYGTTDHQQSDQQQDSAVDDLRLKHKDLTRVVDAAVLSLVYADAASHIQSSLKSTTVDALKPTTVDGKAEIPREDPPHILGQLSKAASEHLSNLAKFHHKLSMAGRTSQHLEQQARGNHAESSRVREGTSMQRNLQHSLTTPSFKIPEMEESAALMTHNKELAEQAYLALSAFRHLQAAINVCKERCQLQDQKSRHVESGSSLFEEYTQKISACEGAQRHHQSIQSLFQTSLNLLSAGITEQDLAKAAENEAATAAAAAAVVEEEQVLPRDDLNRLYCIALLQTVQDRRGKAKCYVEGSLWYKRAGQAAEQALEAANSLTARQLEEHALHRCLRDRFRDDCAALAESWSEDGGGLAGDDGIPRLCPCPHTTQCLRPELCVRLQNLHLVNAAQKATHHAQSVLDELQEFQSSALRNADHALMAHDLFPSTASESQDYPWKQVDDGYVDDDPGTSINDRQEVQPTANIINSNDKVLDPSKAEALDLRREADAAQLLLEETRTKLAVVERDKEVALGQVKELTGAATVIQAAAATDAVSLQAHVVQAAPGSRTCNKVQHLVTLLSDVDGMTNGHLDHVLALRKTYEERAEALMGQVQELSCSVQRMEDESEACGWQAAVLSHRAQCLMRYSQRLALMMEASRLSASSPNNTAQGIMTKQAKGPGAAYSEVASRPHSAEVDVWRQEAEDSVKADLCLLDADLAFTALELESMRMEGSRVSRSVMHQVQELVREAEFASSESAKATAAARITLSVGSCYAAAGSDSLGVELVNTAAIRIHHDLVPSSVNPAANVFLEGRGLAGREGVVRVLDNLHKAARLASKSAKLRKQTDALRSVFKRVSEEEAVASECLKVVKGLADLVNIAQETDDRSHNQCILEGKLDERHQMVNLMHIFHNNVKASMALALATGGKAASASAADVKNKKDAQPSSLEGAQFLLGLADLRRLGAEVALCKLKEVVRHNAIRRTAERIRGTNQENMSQSSSSSSGDLCQVLEALSAECICQLEYIQDLLSSHDIADDYSNTRVATAAVSALNALLAQPRAATSRGINKANKQSGTVVSCDKHQEHRLHHHPQHQTAAVKCRSHYAHGDDSCFCSSGSTTLTPMILEMGLDAASSVKDLLAQIQCRLDSVHQLSQLPRLLGLTFTSDDILLTEDSDRIMFCRSSNTPLSYPPDDDYCRTKPPEKEQLYPAAAAISGAAAAAAAISGAAAASSTHLLRDDEQMDHDQEMVARNHDGLPHVIREDYGETSSRCRCILLKAAASATRLDRLSSVGAENLKRWKDMAEGLQTSIARASEAGSCVEPPTTAGSVEQEVVSTTAADAANRVSPQVLMGLLAARVDALVNSLGRNCTLLQHAASQYQSVLQDAGCCWEQVSWGVDFTTSTSYIKDSAIPTNPHSHSSNNRQSLAATTTENYSLHSILQQIQSLEGRHVALQELERSITSQTAACDAHVRGVACLHSALSDLLLSSSSGNHDDDHEKGLVLSYDHAVAVMAADDDCKLESRRNAAAAGGIMTTTFSSLMSNNGTVIGKPSRGAGLSSIFKTNSKKTKSVAGAGPAGRKDELLLADSQHAGGPGFKAALTLSELLATKVPTLSSGGAHQKNGSRTDHHQGGMKQAMQEAEVEYLQARDLENESCKCEQNYQLLIKGGMTEIISAAVHQFTPASKSDSQPSSSHCDHDQNLESITPPPPSQCANNLIRAGGIISMDDDDTTRVASDATSSAVAELNITVKDQQEARYIDKDIRSGEAAAISSPSALPISSAGCFKSADEMNSMLDSSERTPGAAGGIGSTGSRAAAAAAAASRASAMLTPLVDLRGRTHKHASSLPPAAAQISTLSVIHADTPEGGPPSFSKLPSPLTLYPGNRKIEKQVIKAIRQTLPASTTSVRDKGGGDDNAAWEAAENGHADGSTTPSWRECLHGLAKEALASASSPSSRLTDKHYYNTSSYQTSKHTGHYDDRSKDISKSSRLEVPAALNNVSSQLADRTDVAAQRRMTSYTATPTRASCIVSSALLDKGKNHTFPTTAAAVLPTATQLHLNRRIQLPSNMSSQTAAALLKLWQRLLTVAVSGQLLAACLAEALGQCRTEGAARLVVAVQECLPSHHMQYQIVASKQIQGQLIAIRAKEEKCVSDAGEARVMVERLRMIMATLDGINYSGQRSHWLDRGAADQDSLEIRQQQKETLVEAGLRLSDACSVLYEGATTSCSNPSAIMRLGEKSGLQKQGIGSKTSYNIVGRLCPAGQRQGHSIGRWSNRLGRDTYYPEACYDDSSNRDQIVSSEGHSLMLGRCLRQLQEVKAWLLSLVEDARRREVELKEKAERFKRMSKDLFMRADMVVMVHESPTTSTFPLSAISIVQGSRQHEQRQRNSVAASKRERYRLKAQEASEAYYELLTQSQAAGAEHATVEALYHASEQIWNTALSSAEESLKSMTHLSDSTYCALDLVMMLSQHEDQQIVRTMDHSPPLLSSGSRITPSSRTFHPPACSNLKQKPAMAAFSNPKPAMAAFSQQIPSTQRHNHTASSREQVNDVTAAIPAATRTSASIFLSQCLENSRLALSCESRSLVLSEQVLKGLGSLVHDCRSKLHTCFAELEEKSTKLRMQSGTYQEEANAARNKANRATDKSRETTFASSTTFLTAPSAIMSAANHPQRCHDHDHTSTAYLLVEAAEGWHRVAEAAADSAQELLTSSESAATAASHYLEAAEKAPDVLEGVSKSFALFVEDKCRAVLQCTKQLALATPATSLIFTPCDGGSNNESSSSARLRGLSLCLNQQHRSKLHNNGDLIIQDMVAAASVMGSDKRSSSAKSTLFHDLGISRWVARSNQ
ncbi:hypothetical protein CEUSTIGMA_g4797.t1 [Chlamydomonas eustigma]|uniref:Uncharacterized protein n=1 Tax=Chlamydomonas eustigma TaxID=1157962 RepID=A0A250X2Q6_9CHLO|nr:hypothetical protein CEUSTIGMA_g4797.t1 [Chlamydomonas eustigma]|eukprot:GAX77351.1 hypothetical protein CEUSTIGMA_g4797.t1 [Chlamydomonas eustigma]